MLHSRCRQGAVSVLLFALPGLAQSILLNHVTVIDATGAPPRTNLSVWIADGRIKAIGKNIRAGPGARVLEAKGKFLIPGLWDMHMHLDPSGSFLPLLAANGITGVREMFTGIPLDTIRAWRMRPDSPRIAAGGLLDGPPMLWGGSPLPGSYAVSTPEEARLAVRALARSGYDFAKVYNSVPRNAYFAIAEESRAAGILFAGHVPEAVSPAEASDAGQRSQEHLINILLACSTREDELREERIATMLDPRMPGEERMRRLAFPQPEGLFDTYSEEKAAALFRTFVKNGTWQTPTLTLLDAFAYPSGDDLVRKMFFLKDLAPAEYDALKLRVRAVLARHKKLTGDMHRAGVGFLAGTDTNQWNSLPPGASLHRELALLVESGFTPLEALQCATRNPARYFGALDDMGTVEAGKVADLVLLSADPLRDIRNTRKIDAVVMRGRYYSRLDLDAWAAAAR